MKKTDRRHRIAFAVVAFIVKIAAGLLLKMRIETDDTVKAWKKGKDGFVTLCAHPSEFDAAVLLAASFPRYTRFVAGAQQLYKPGLQSKLLRMLGVIPKKQFTSDIASIKEMMATVKGGDVLAMMPEGRVSTDGTPGPIDIATAKLIKKMGVAVAGLIPHGTFFVKPSYNYSGLIRGRVSGEMKAILSAEEAAVCSPEEICRKIAEALEYNASEELRGSGRTYAAVDGAYMKGVSNLFYLCPKCGELLTVSDAGSVISCSACGIRLKALPTMFLEGEAGMPDTVAGWNKLQKEFERKFWAEEGACLEFHVRKDTMVLKTETEYTEKGDGLLNLSAEGLAYTDSEESFSVPLAAVPGVSVDYQFGHIVFYQGDLMRRFTFGDKRLAARFINSLMVLKECDREQ